MPSAARSKPSEAKAETSSTKKRRGDTAWSTIWNGFETPSPAGRDSGRARSASRSKPALPAAASCVPPVAHPLARTGLQAGTSDQPALPSALVSRTSAITPITRASAPPASAMRPMGSCPGQSFRATVSLMMTTFSFLGPSCPADVAPFDQAHAHSIEIARRNDINKDALKFPAVGIVSAFRFDSPTSGSGS